MEPFDTDRALEDLEKLHEQILEARARRQRTEEEFDTFTRRARVDSAAPAVEAQPAIRAPRARAGAIGPAAANTNTTSAVPPTSDAAAGETVPDARRAFVPPRRARRRTGAMLAIAGVAATAIAAATILAVRQPQPDIPEATQDTPASASAPEPVVATAPVAAAAAPPAAVAPGVHVEVVTRRRVWMRVTLDGARAFEREVPAGEHIPLQAARSIVIRAGDAGAVAIVRNGRDAGTLGRDGVIATREFTIDAGSRR